MNRMERTSGAIIHAQLNISRSIHEILSIFSLSLFFEAQFCWSFMFPRFSNFATRWSLAVHDAIFTFPAGPVRPLKPRLVIERCDACERIESENTKCERIKGRGRENYVCWRVRKGWKERERREEQRKELCLSRSIRPP